MSFPPVLILLLLITTTATATPKIGVTFDPTTPNLPPLSSIVTSLIHHKIPTVHLINPTPASIHSFHNTNITLLLTIPFTNQSSSATWITTHILPFYKTTRISLISINSTTPDITLDHFTAFRTLYSSLHEFGIVNVSVSVTVPFQTILDVETTPFEHQFLIRLLVNYLETTNSSFLVTLHQPCGDWKLFDKTVDTVSRVTKAMGEKSVPIIVAEVGWTSSETAEEEKRVCLKGLRKHLWGNGYGALLRNKRVREAYVYELFGDEWGIMDRNLSLKYELDFSGFEVAKKVMGFKKWLIRKVLFGGILVFIVLFLLPLVVDCVKERRNKDD